MKTLLSKSHEILIITND